MVSMRTEQVVSDHQEIKCPVKDFFRALCDLPSDRMEFMTADESYMRYGTGTGEDAVWAR